jgi:F-type H+-transporting ATPase subunit b
MLRSLTTVLVLLLATVFAVSPAAGADANPAAAADPNIFEPRLDLTIWTIVVFVLLLLVLRRFAWKPMLEGLRGRESRVRGALDEAQRAREAAHQLRDRLHTELAGIQDKLRALMDDARRDAQDARDRLVAEGKADLQAERDRAHRELSTAREQAVQELWGEAARLATLVSARVIGRSLDDESHRALVEEAVNELQGAAGAPARVAEVPGTGTRSHP